ncbi:thioredoxin domain-containing protein [Candidatus Acetothermia bacterium]|nr:thioredoxin domain-containing protein [Candidatus Acetothermia bacterium]
MAAKKPADSSTKTNKQKPKMSPMFLILIIGGAVVLGLGAIGVSWWLSQGSQPADAEVSFVPSGQQFTPDMGSKDAPVTVVEYADFQCPVCGTFAHVFEPQLTKLYVAQGKVRFQFHNYAFLGPESLWAATASMCAADQGYFWDYHNKLYNSQRGENRGAFSRDNLKKFARELKLDGSKFDQCLDSHKYDKEISDQNHAAEQRSVKATPTLFINDYKLEGLPRTFSELAKLIDDRLH